MVLYRSVLLGSTCIWLILSLLGDCNCKPGREKNGNEMSCWPFSIFSRKSREKPQTGQRRPTPTQTYKKFGCEFEDENYFVYTDSTFDPVFGEEVSPMYFASVDEFEAMKAEIDKEYTKVMAGVVFTDLPMMLDLYDAYKAYQIKSKKEEVTFKFFHEYVPKFHRHECVGLAVELLERLVNRFPKMSENVHLITNTLDVWDGNALLYNLGIEEMKHYNATRKAPEPPKYDFHNGHAAALLRINIEGRLGYVLMDPGLNLERPVVIMEDRKLPHEVEISEYGGQEWSRFYLPRQNYVASASSYRPQGTHTRYSWGLYYIGRPYCSFLMTTMKPNVLKTRVRVARRTAQAFPEASISFDLRVGYGTFILLMNLRGAKYENYNRKIEDNKVPFARRYSKETYKQLYNDVMKVVNYNGLEELLSRAQNVSQDNAFLFYITRLNELMNQVRKFEINEIALKTASFKYHET